jgi:hypothetical protein
LSASEELEIQETVPPEQFSMSSQAIATIRNRLFVLLEFNASLELKRVLSIDIEKDINHLEKWEKEVEMSKFHQIISVIASNLRLL